MSYYPETIPRCQHIKVNGTQCGSPALKRNKFCFFHKRWRETRIVISKQARRSRASLDLPVLEDANSVQVALMQVMRLTLRNQIDPKVAGLLFYGLQTASCNLRNANFEPIHRTEVVIDPRTVDETALGEDPWEPADFETEEEEDTEAAGVEEAVQDNEQEFDEHEDEEPAQVAKAVARTPEKIGNGRSRRTTRNTENYGDNWKPSPELLALKDLMLGTKRSPPSQILSLAQTPT